MGLEDHRSAHVARPRHVKQHVTPCTTKGPDCADDLEALDWPAALAPVQQRISVPEGETGQIEFTCWEGM